MSLEVNLKRTSIYSEHIKLGAKLVPFAGWEMPVQYSGIIEEHNCVREKVGIFDVSHMGEFTVKGPSASDFVNFLITNDFSKIVPGQAMYSPMLYEDGGIVDDLLAYKKSEEDILLVVNASNLAKDFTWISDLTKRFNFEVTLGNISGSISEFAVQGPSAEKVMHELFGESVSGLGFFRFIEVKFSNHDILISRTGYTGEDGFEIYMENHLAPEIWNQLFTVGKAFGIQPIGLAARDTLRFEAKLMLYGNDITKDTNPLEAGLKWTVKLDKSDFFGKEALLKIKESGLTRRLVGFEMIDRGIPRHDYKIFKDNNEIGFVTSGTHAPFLKKNLGLGYVSFEHRKKGTEIFIEVRGRLLKAVVVATPFYKRKK